jgi:SAM-dependent methyltransferase
MAFFEGDMMLTILKRILPDATTLRACPSIRRKEGKGGFRGVASMWGRAVMNHWRIARNRGKLHRRLEIGPGPEAVHGFETLNVVWTRGVDYVADAARSLPFDDNTFEVIYASHILEHIPWYQVDAVFREWVRVLAPGGALEICVPDGLKICQELVNYEERGESHIDQDGWYRLNPERNPYCWTSGRLYSYGDGTGNPWSHNWHRSLFTAKYLRALLEKAGLVDVRPIREEEIRGASHGWINLGVRGKRP